MSPRRLAAVGLLAVALAGAGCGIELDQIGLACDDPPTEEEILGDRVVPELIGLPPGVAAKRLEVAGIVATWRYTYHTDPTSRTIGYSECWCEPPPDGQVEHVFAEPNEQLTVFVRRTEPIPGGRQQPTQGWGC